MATGCKLSDVFPDKNHIESIGDDALKSVNKEYYILLI